MSMESAKETDSPIAETLIRKQNNTLIIYHLKLCTTRISAENYEEDISFDCELNCISWYVGKRHYYRTGRKYCQTISEQKQPDEKEHWHENGSSATTPINRDL